MSTSPQAFLACAPRCVPARLARWAKEIAAASLVTGVDAFILAAIMDRESRGGDALTPKGSAGTGDRGNACGLMQVDRRYHGGFLAGLGPTGAPLWHDAAFSVLYGARLLEANLKSFDGDLLAGIAAYNASAKRVRAALEALPAGASELARLAAVDSVTTGRNYVSWVLTRRREYLAFL